MLTSFNAQARSTNKTPAVPISDERKREVVAQFWDDVLSKLTGSFFDVCKFEKWTKRDLSKISGINETAIGHILAGRRKNLTVETIAVLARAMQVRPELVLHDTRPIENNRPMKGNANAAIETALPFRTEPQPSSVGRLYGLIQDQQTSDSLQHAGSMALSSAYGSSGSYGKSSQ